ncbi:MAG: tRNA 2-selenouridine(34) synthase MnmH [Prevotellaceae bacterium]|jgi:tRNA 2-selenouridine synthase|nr:tRNA 2-selenouridine(34) synthase MnmH [Prevotellaceae bacterium]
MCRSISIDEFLERAKETPVVDVRSPAEFAQGHIPGAHNLPLFDNEERAEVGTLYVQKGKIQAVQKGLEIVGPKMRRLTDFAINLKSAQLLLYCWRGGKRSAAMAWLLETVGISCLTLEQGYKVYRNHVLEWFAKPLKIVLLGGFTGGGKTEILHALHVAGEQVLDLEALANHKGSAFGGIGQAPQPTTEQFENLIYAKIISLDPAKRIWIEDESRNVGKCSIPIQLWDQMRHAPLLCVVTHKSDRIMHLMHNYAYFDRKLLCAAIQKIEKRLGFDRCKAAITACETGDIQAALEICLDYYDKAYTNQLFERFGQEWESILPQFTPHFPLDSGQIQHLISLTI